MTQLVPVGSIEGFVGVDERVIASPFCQHLAGLSGAQDRFLSPILAQSFSASRCDAIAR